MFSFPLFFKCVFFFQILLEQLSDIEYREDVVDYQDK